MSYRGRGTQPYISMEKVILVINKPKSCMFCPLIDGENSECKEGGIIEDNENPTYCPLRPVPESLNWKFINETTDTNSFEYGRCVGRQELIDEILEEIV